MSLSSYPTDNSCQLIEKTLECSAVLTEKSLLKENGNFVPSDLLDFLSEDEMKGEMDLSDFECLNNLDLELDISLRGEWGLRGCHWTMSSGHAIKRAHILPNI